jgi:hypothetical protein
VDWRRERLRHECVIQGLPETGAHDESAAITLNCGDADREATRWLLALKNYNQYDAIGQA